MRPIIRVSSNRHWEFVQRDILFKLNDKLALRHGAEYWLEVPETSHDWDAEMAVRKDSSGNNLGEQYVKAWVRPALVGPKSDDVRPLNTKVKWDAVSGIDQKDEQLLMVETDKHLGSPLKEEQEEAPEEQEERPTKVTNREDELKVSHKRLVKLSNLLRVAIDVEQEIEDELQSKSSIELVVSALQAVEDAKLVNNDEVQQLEVQRAYDLFSQLKGKPSTGILAVVAETIANEIRNGTLTEVRVYDLLSRLTRDLENSLHKLDVYDDYKMEVYNDVVTALMAYCGEDNQIVPSASMQDLTADQLYRVVKEAVVQLRQLREGVQELKIRVPEELQQTDQGVVFEEDTIGEEMSGENPLDDETVVENPDFEEIEEPEGAEAEEAIDTMEF